MLGKDRLSEKWRSGEVCWNLARIASRDENERDMAMSELRRDWVRGAVGEFNVQDSEANISVDQRHRARHATGGGGAAVEIVLHQPRHGASNDGVIFNNEDALLHKESNAAHGPSFLPHAISLMTA
jgi:hypothetical protein